MLLKPHPMSLKLTPSTDGPTPPLTRLVALARAVLQGVGLLAILHYFLFPHTSIAFSTSLSLFSSLPSWLPVTFSSPESPLDAWIVSQEQRSLQGVLANIGDSGVHAGAQGAKPGIVVASPSTSSPNYVYSWTRDAALVTKSLLELSIKSGNASLLNVLEDYTTAQAIIQHVPNPSGTFETGGLGEPKFNVDETAFTENWGRPQNDGPALRATTLIGYANHLLDKGENSFVHLTLAPIIRADLNYVVQYWNETGFDLWEEVRGSSFFTTAVQHRALREGATFFETIGAPNPEYASAANEVLCFLQDYWSPSKGFVVSNINSNDGRGGLDGNSILGSIHTFDREAITCDDATFQPCSARALSNHKAVVDSFRSIYSINQGIAPGSAVAIGRYPEDVYYAGNPWYLITLAAAEQLFDALHTWDLAGELNITSVSLPFFRSLVPSASIGTYHGTSSAYAEIVEAVRAYADGFFAIVHEFTPGDGSFAEQFDKVSGTPLSATDLTWSYASFVTASAARRGEHPAGWGSEGLVPACPVAGATDPILVTFQETAVTTLGETIYVVGSIPELGTWDPSNAVPLNANNYVATAPIWSGSVTLPAARSVEYKFIRKLPSGTIVWESGANRLSPSFYSNDP